ncbi:MAG: DUF4428 domain-containing protein [Clostridiales bacterium]|nr:DUF4428 domain-containing protein [Clostridiales bacterium]
MGLFGKIFEKKECSICGGEIGLLGNRKLEDGNLCKECAAKLSPWFSDRRNSTVTEIQEQLAYREDNKRAVDAFHTTCSFGRNTKILIDEDAKKFMVTSARNLKDANPDVLDFSQVTGCDLDIEEDRSEETREDAEGNSVSYNPPWFCYSYDFKIIIRVNHPYFDTMSFQLNPSGVEINPENATSNPPNPRLNQDYKEYEAMGKEIKEILTRARQQVREEKESAAKPKTAVQCPYCGATTIPDANGHCEYCGGAVQG